jgi:hypothetical protein
MPKPQPHASAETVGLYEEVVTTLTGVERKGAALPYTAINGNMFSLCTKEGHVALRLPEAAREAFLKKYKTTLCETYGHVMPEYVIVPPSLLKKTAELKPHFAASLAYTAALKPKPNASAKAAKKSTKKG